MKFITTTEAGKKWGLSSRRMAYLDVFAASDASICWPFCILRNQPGICDLLYTGNSTFTAQNTYTEGK